MKTLSKRRPVHHLVPAVVVIKRRRHHHRLRRSQNLAVIAIVTLAMTRVIQLTVMIQQLQLLITPRRLMTLIHKPRRKRNQLVRLRQHIIRRPLQRAAANIVRRHQLVQAVPRVLARQARQQLAAVVLIVPAVRRPILQRRRLVQSLRQLSTVKPIAGIIP